MCCVIESCFLTFPECFGIESKSVCCCLSIDALLCKCVSKDPKICCIFQRTDCVCISPSTCIKGVNQCCCFDSRCAFPCDKDVPCIVSLLPFCTCCVNWGFKITWCMKIGDMLKK